MTVTLEPDKTTRFSYRVGTPPAKGRVSVDKFRHGMRHFAGALNVITVQLDGASYGLTATSVCSLSAEPPRLLACVNIKGSSFEAIRQRGAFAVNTLAFGQEAVALRFSGGGNADTDRFETGIWQRSKSLDLPILEGACCVFECSLCEVIDSGTHALLIADIIDVLPSVSAAPLIYHDGTFRGLLEL